MPIGSQQLEKTFDLAVATMHNYLKPSSKVTIEKARAAQSVINSAVKMKASEQSHQGMKLSFFAKIAKDKDELKNYMLLTNPGFAPALMGKTIDGKPSRKNKSK